MSDSSKRAARDDWDARTLAGLGKLNQAVDALGE